MFQLSSWEKKRTIIFFVYIYVWHVKKKQHFSRSLSTSEMHWFITLVFFFRKLIPIIFSSLFVLDHFFSSFLLYSLAIRMVQNESKVLYEKEKKKHRYEPDLSFIRLACDVTYQIYLFSLKENWGVSSV